MVVRNSAKKIALVTPADTDLENGVTDGVLLDATGTVSLTFADGTETDTINLVGGVIHPIQARRIRAIATATKVWAVYAGSKG